MKALENTFLNIFVSTTTSLVTKAPLRSLHMARAAHI
jgi:hypothetical protein